MAAYDDPSVYPKEYYNYGQTAPNSLKYPLVGYAENADKACNFPYSPNQGGILSALTQARTSKYKLELASTNAIIVDTIEVKWEDHFVKFFKTANTLVLAVPEDNVRSILLMTE